MIISQREFIEMTYTGRLVYVFVRTQMSTQPKGPLISLTVATPHEVYNMSMVEDIRSKRIYFLNIN